jgi:hypothetical protein
MVYRLLCIRDVPSAECVAALWTEPGTQPRPIGEAVPYALEPAYLISDMSFLSR